MKKSLISLLLIFVISFGLIASPIKGEASDLDLTLNITNSKYAGRILLDDDCVYVFSHIFTNQAEYYISSTTLVNSISSDKYDISYVDENKVSKKVSSVKDGYLKLSSSGDVRYLPVKTNTPLIWSEDFTDFSSTGYYRMYKGGVLAKQYFEKDFGSKGENDTSFCIKGNGDSAITPNGEGEVYLQRNLSMLVNHVMTMDFSFCNNSNSTVYVNGKFVSLNDILKVNSKGDVYVRDEYCGKVTHREWHDVSLALDYTRSRLLVFIDGKFLAEPYMGFSGEKFDHFKFSMKGEKDSDGNPLPAYGSVAFDDVEIYGGYPKNINTDIPGLISDTYLVDNVNHVIYGAMEDSVQSVLNAITPELGGNLTIADSVIDENSVAVLSHSDSANPEKMCEYTFSADSHVSPMFISNVGEGIIDDVDVNFSAIAGVNDKQKNVIFALATYKNDTLTSLQIEKADISHKKDFSFKTCIDREENEEIKLFLWNGSLAPSGESSISDKIQIKTVFKEDYWCEELMNDYIAVHSRSGLITAYGKKTLLDNKPYVEGNVIYIDPVGVSKALGLSCTVSGNVIKVGSSSYYFNNSIKVNNILYIPAKTYFEKFHSLKTSLFSTELNSGIIIAGENTFSVPEDIDKQALNDYLFNLRPTQSEIKKMYSASPLKGEHPRIYIDSADLERIKRETETNEFKKQWKKDVIALANYNLSKPIVEYVIDEGGRLLGVSRKVLTYMHCFGMAYLLTGEQKYVDRAFQQLEAAANFPDWHPDHTLDTGEMCAAFAVGYDWMYDAFTPEQRRIIEEGFLKNGIQASNNLYEGVSGRTSAVYAESNWGAVVNGGIATGAFAFYDVYPENCSEIISNAVRGYDYLIYHFAPEGGWYEGPGYWEYTIKYTAKMLSCSQKILGTDFGFPYCEGFNKTVDYELSMQSSLGTFSYGDCMPSQFLVPEIFWISNTLNKPEYTSSLMAMCGGSMKDEEDRALALCWYDVSNVSSDIFMVNDYWVKGEDVVSMRSGWSITDSYFAATAGINGGGHDHLDSGGFVFDTGGVRWVTDLGQGNYNNTRYRYFDGDEDGERWKIFRLRAESHSTVVINPSAELDQKYRSYTEISRFESGDNTSIVTLDMTDALSKDASSAKRGFALTDSKQSLVIRDEITLSDKDKENVVCSLFITTADVELTKDGAILTKDGKTLYLKFASDVNAEISVAPAATFDTTGVIDSAEETAKRIVIKMTSDDKANLTVTLSQKDGKNLLDSFNKSIDLWTTID